MTLAFVSKPLSWLDDLLSCPGGNLQKLVLIGRFEAIGTFSVDDLVKYYQTRGNISELTLQFTNVVYGTYANDPKGPMRRERFEKLAKELSLKLYVWCSRGHYFTIECFGLKDQTCTKPAPLDAAQPVDHPSNGNGPKPTETDGVTVRAGLGRRLWRHAVSKLSKFRPRNWFSRSGNPRN
uniref:Uncharacterized protein n=1 Tax=Panagrellus redivivus TaxID=6233 RepID=A0A7E4WE82_PANRE